MCFQQFTSAYVGSNGIIRAQSAKFWAKNWANLNPFLSSLFSSAVDSRVLAEADIIYTDSLSSANERQDFGPDLRELVR